MKCSIVNSKRFCNQQINRQFTFISNKFLEFFFMGPLTSLFWTFGNVCPGFQNKDGSLLLCALSPVCNRFLRFTSNATPADLLTASIAPQPSDNSHQTSNSLCVKFSVAQWSWQTKKYHAIQEILSFSLLWLSWRNNKSNVFKRLSFYGSI